MRPTVFVDLAASSHRTARERAYRRSRRPISSTARSATVRTQVSIIVDQGKIADVVDGFVRRIAGDAVIDWSDHTVHAGADGHARAPRPVSFRARRTPTSSS